MEVLIGHSPISMVYFPSFSHDFFVSMTKTCATLAFASTQVGTRQDAAAMSSAGWGNLDLVRGRGCRAEPYFVESPEAEICTNPYNYGHTSVYIYIYTCILYDHSFKGYI